MRPDMISPCIPVLGRFGLGTGTLASLGRAASLPEVSGLLDEMEINELRTIDTADCYGSGDCERLLGKAMAGRRSKFSLITKGGIRYGNLPGPLRPFNQFLKKGIQKLGYRQCFESFYLRKCLDQSLRRLGSEQVEAFLLHDPSAEVASSSEIAELFFSIKQQGKARFTGVSSGDTDVLRAAINNAACDLIECPAHLRVPAAMLEIWEVCQSRGIHVVGNYIFEPSALWLTGGNRLEAMRGSAGLLPDHATILCGTKNPSHLRASYQWALDPLPLTQAMRLRQAESL